MAVSPLAMQPYQTMDEQTLAERIQVAREQLGDKLVILGHHYQRDEVFRHADFSGDSLKLSRLAAESSAQYIIFCGVHFMAEVADILSRPEQVAILPDLAAGCSMADMANLVNVERAWAEINEVLGDADEKVTPVTYINSAADLKAFCGQHGGIVCTSSNAKKILDWSFERREKVLFFPDQHLGRNTAARMGIAMEDMVVWDFDQPMGGLTAEQIKKAKMILWKGFCSVHQMFQPEHIERFRAKYPQGKVISHPENAWEVCEQSDYVGSTEVIIKTVRESAPGTRWLVGTELNLVNRLAAEMKEKNVDVHFMSPTVCMCSTMFRISPGHLLWTMENLLEGKVVNQIKVADEEKQAARLALQRMLDVSA
jgi:quinolinate synthase